MQKMNLFIVTLLGWVATQVSIKGIKLKKDVGGSRLDKTIKQAKRRERAHDKAPEPAFEIKKLKPLFLTPKL